METSGQWGECVCIDALVTLDRSTAREIASTKQPSVFREVLNKRVFGPFTSTASSYMDLSSTCERGEFYSFQYTLRFSSGTNKTSEHHRNLPNTDHLKQTIEYWPYTRARRSRILLALIASTRNPSRVVSAHDRNLSYKSAHIRHGQVLSHALWRRMLTLAPRPQSEEDASYSAFSAVHFHSNKIYTRYFLRYNLGIKDARYARRES